MIEDQISGPLTAEQIASFHAHGYVAVPGLYTPAEMVDIGEWVDDVQRWPETAGEHMMYFETGAAGERLLNRVENVPPFHAGFRDLVTGDKMRGACAQLFGEQAVLFKDKINFKMPGGGGFEPHQDVQAGWSRYSDLHITSLVTIDPATIENGCLEIATNFRGHDLIGSEWTPLTDKDLAGVEFAAIEAEPGDAVFFDSFIPHLSAPNRTSSPRRVLYYTYNKASAGDHLSQYYADKRASYPPDIEREEGQTYEYRV